MSTKQKLNPPTGVWDLKEILDEIANDGQVYAEKRPRTSRKEGDWEELKDAEKEVYNLERFNYRLGEAPPLRLVDDRVICADEEYISVEYAKRIVKDALRAWSHKEPLEGGEGEKYTYHIDGEGDGTVRVGCQTYDRKTVQDFIRKVGWGGSTAAKGKKKAPAKAKRSRQG